MRRMLRHLLATVLALFAGAIVAVVLGNLAHFNYLLGGLLLPEWLNFAFAAVAGVAAAAAIFVVVVRNGDD